MRTNYAKTNQNKLIRIISEYGFIHLIQRIKNRLLLQPLIAFFGPTLFTANNRQYIYFRHSYNTTFINERAVEIPIFLELLNTFSGSNILEIGNVMSHYVKPSWTIIDKFEHSKHVQNIDILEHIPEKPYKLIFAISTFEHIGFDESPKDEQKLIRVLQHLKSNCLAKNGKIIFSIPLGYNHNLDKLISTKEIETQKILNFERTSFLNTWKQLKSFSPSFKKSYDMLCKELAIIEL